MTTNLAEVYNWVLRGVRSLALVGIIEFFLYRTCEYFRDRYAVAGVEPGLKHREGQFTNTDN